MFLVMDHQNIFTGSGVNDLISPIFNDIISRGNRVAPRGMGVLELIPAVMSTSNPRERMLFHRKRKKYNLPFNLAEVLWILSGREDVEMLAHYNARIADYSDDGDKFNAPYGHRLRRYPLAIPQVIENPIFGGKIAWGDYVDQLEQVKARIDEDAFTRRAVALIFDPRRDYANTKDVPCNNWLNFYQRDGKLHLNVAVRSNDAYWGALNANYMQFSHILEVVAGWTGYDVGTYTVFASNLHLYEERLDEIKPIIEDEKSFNIYHYIKPLDGRMPKDVFDRVFPHIIDLEYDMRMNLIALSPTYFESMINSIPNDYWKDVMYTLWAYNLHKNGFYELAIEVADGMKGEYAQGILEFMLRRHLKKDERLAQRILSVMNPTVRDYLMEE